MEIPLYPPRPQRGSLPLSSSASCASMCDIDQNFEIPPLIFSLHRNCGHTDEPRGSNPTAASSGGSSRDSGDLQIIKLKV